MEMDTGSAVTLLSAADFCKLGGHIETLKSPTVILKSYTGDIFECLGEKEIEFKIGDQLDSLLVRVVKGPSILGRDLMAKFKLPWQNIFHTVSKSKSVRQNNRGKIKRDSSLTASERSQSCVY